MNLPEQFIQHIKETKLFSAQDSLWLAVSGGLDSVVLTELCYRAGFSFRIAHCNFQLRGEESERDALFVRQLADQYKVQAFIRNFDTEQYAALHQLSIQEAARVLRYQWFEELLKKDNKFTTCLLTAHHADDNIETLLMHFFRGTGLHGLTGIPAVNGSIRRPLLPFTREELMTFAQENSLQWVEDSSNSSSKYTRNYFRNELIPGMEKVFPQVRENLLKNISRFRETESLYQLALAPLKKKLLIPKGNEWHIPARLLTGFNNRALHFEIISGFGFSEKQIDELIKLSGAASGRYILSADGRYRIIKHRHWLIVSPVQENKAAKIIIERDQEKTRFPLGELKVVIHQKEQKTTQVPGRIVEELDVRKISFPLMLRQWTTGDYFYPLGMRKKKKIARFLIDAKLSKTEKEKIWVLESDQRIIWVVGQRIDDRFKITPSTKEVLRLELNTQTVPDL